MDDFVRAVSSASYRLSLCAPRLRSLLNLASARIRRCDDSAMHTTSHSEKPDFSLVSGGLLFRAYRRTHLSGAALEWLERRALVLTLLAWLPLLFLSILEGYGFGGAIQIPFVRDIEAHVRFLIALPLLIGAEVTVHHRIGPAVRKFMENHIVAEADSPKLVAAIISAQRVRDSFAAELLLLVLVYTMGLWVWRSHIALGAATWYARPQGGHLRLTLAGYWNAYVSIPIFQFILLRWYLRLIVWFRFLWQVSRLNLQLSAAHPDLAGGLGFLGKSSYGFSPVLFAQGALLSGLIASRVLYGGQTLRSFQVEAVGYLLFFLLVILGPLVMFSPQLLRAELEGRSKYGLLANRYVSKFEEKWLRNGAAETSELLGTADLQSLADLANSYAVVRSMRVVPFGIDDVIRLAAATAAPLLPLALTILSPAELLTSFVRIFF